MYPNNFNRMTPYASLQNPYNPYNQQYTNPYQQQPDAQQMQSNYQQTAITQQMKGINGRVIGNVNEVTPNEVPMDGNISLFPMNDYSCIYAKMWNTDGTIQTIKFIPVVDNVQEAPQAKQLTNEHYNNIVERLDKIEQMLAIQKKSNARATKKEEVNE